jgi:hypothetical protein
MQMQVERMMQMRHRPMQMKHRLMQMQAAQMAEPDDA